MYDLLITGGRVFSPTEETFTRADISVSQGRIARIAPGLGVEGATEVVNASGMIVTPGLIDFHVHCFRLVHRISVDADALAPRSGTTTMVDGGSAGALNFDAFREFILERSRLNLYAFLNISLIGQCFAQTSPGATVVRELEDLRLVDVAQAVRCIEANRDVIVGVKVRALQGLANLTPLYAAREAADAVGLPLMVHTAPPPPSKAQYFHLLRPGDFITHLYHPGPGALVDRRGEIRPAYRELRERGVLMETGFDTRHTDFEVMKRAVDQGFWPDIISTDITTHDLDRLVFDLLYAASRMLAVGMALEKVLCAMTIAPARALGRPGLAEVKEGAPADLAILERREEDVEFEDQYAHRLRGSERLLCRRLIREGRPLA